MQTTTDFLDQLRERTERILQQAIGEWQMLAPTILHAAPAPQQWSAAQCLEHLNIYGRHYLPAIQIAIEAGKRRGISPAALYRSGWLGQWFTNLMLPQPDGQLKSKMKAPKNAIPAAQPDARAMLAEFIEQQETLLALIDAAAMVNLNTLRVPTSLSPMLRLKLGDTFAFVIAHNERHVLQIGRAVNSFERHTVQGV
jgi:DinB superfamily